MGYFVIYLRINIFVKKTKDIYFNETKPGKKLYLQNRMFSYSFFFSFILLYKFVLFRLSVETSPRSLYYAKDTLSQRWYLTNEGTGEFSHEARSAYVATRSDTGEFSGRIQTVKSQIFMCSLDQLNYGTSPKPDCFTNSYFESFLWENIKRLF